MAFPWPMPYTDFWPAFIPYHLQWKMIHQQDFERPLAENLESHCQGSEDRTVLKLLFLFNHFSHHSCHGLGWHLQWTIPSHPPCSFSWLVSTCSDRNRTYVTLGSFCHNIHCFIIISHWTAFVIFLSISQFGEIFQCPSKTLLVFTILNNFHLTAHP